MKRERLLIISFFLACSAFVWSQNYLSVQGNKLVDSNGNIVRLTGVNWFGFETSLFMPHGLWSRDCKSMLQQIKDQGFNCIRIPWCNDMLADDAQITSLNSYGTDPYTGVNPMNEYESTLTKPVELLDVIVEWCQENNMKIILDNHSRQHDGYMNELLWYTDATPESQWIEDWVFLTDRYKNNDAVIAMDLNNEPHGKYGNGATWGDSNPDTDWNKAAERCGNAILEVNPNVLIMVEGIEEYMGETYWWGGNLKGVNDYPVQLSNPDKLMYSPHEYGPTVHNQEWFSASDFPDNMPAIWEENFNFILTKEISPLLIGEFGIRDSGGADEIWFDYLLEYMAGRGYSWTFWCWNPNSGDTGGLLDDQWVNIVEWKMDKLTPYLAAEIPNGEVDTTSSPENEAPIAVVSATPTSGIEPLTVEFNASGSSDPDNDDLTYTWDFDDGETASGISVSHTYSEGSYIVILTVNDGTDSDMASITITVNADEDDDNAYCKSPEEISLPFSIDGSGTYCYFTTDEIAYVNSWNMDLLEINGEDYTNIWSDSMPAKQDGGYYIYYEGSYAWSSFEAFALKASPVTLSLEEAGIVIYPNPFQQELNIDLGNLSNVCRIELFNSLGQLVYAKQLTDKYNRLVQFDITEKGAVFILKISTDNLIITQSVIRK